MATITQTRTENEVVSDAAELRRLLVAHDRSLQQIVLINSYISRLTKQAIAYMRLGKKGQAIRVMNRKSVALGVKHAYRSFRLRKWYQVQRQVTTIIRSLQSHTPTTQTPPLVEATGHAESEQMEMVSKTMMVVHSNFNRID